jgi:hypothetical protein
MGRLLRSHRATLMSVFIATSCLAIVLSCCSALAQTKTLNGKEYTKYKRKHFEPKKGLSYSFFVSPVITVDPLGVRGKSTYAFGGGGTLTLWESKAASSALQGLKLQSLYIGAGFENYPQSFDKVYFALGLRIKTFIPIAARMEQMIDIAGDKVGTSVRFCLGLEFKRVTLFVCGVTGYSIETPVFDSPYSNAGAILLVIPVYTHIGKFKK